MTLEGFKRKLTAILNADVEGYCRLMRENEETTIRTLTTYRGVMATLIQKYRGRVVDSPGDNLLAEFPSIEHKLDLEFEDLGDHQVKNIAKPVRVYRVLTYPGAAAPKVEPAAVEKMAFPLPEKPSIAVLAFDNMSGDPEQGYLADGISENIITALAYIPEMFVIARNSSFTYKGKPVKVQQVSEELGVRYVLEGSVLKSEDKVRITAQLIDALTGGHIWSERYDRDLKDLFRLLDEIAMAVTVALQVKLTIGEQARLETGSTLNFEAWGYLAKAKSIFYKFGKEDMVRARELCEKAIRIDPKYANAVQVLAWTHKIDAHFG